MDILPHGLYAERSKSRGANAADPRESLRNNVHMRLCWPSEKDNTLFAGCCMSSSIRGSNEHLHNGKDGHRGMGTGSLLYFLKTSLHALIKHLVIPS